MVSFFCETEERRKVKGKETTNDLDVSGSDGGKGREEEKAGHLG
jgi:hypothetical protein